MSIADNTAWLLSHPGEPLGHNTICSRYLYLLAKRELVNYKGGVLIDAFIESFQAKFPMDFLTMLNCDFDCDYKWVFRLFRMSTKAIQQPQRHLLLMSYLGCSVKEFFDLPDDLEIIKRQPGLSQLKGMKILIKDHPEPFGRGPWPCLNPVSGHYKEPRVNNCEIKYSRCHAEVTGIFHCDCGFSYCRRGPDKLPSDRFKRTRIKRFGPVWDSKLVELWADINISLIKLARQLGVAAYTAKVQAARLNLSFPRPTRKSTVLKPRYISPTRKFEETRNFYRGAWLSAVNENPEAGRKVLHDKSKSVYAWLRKNDSEWHDAHMPPKRHRETRNVQPRVDWSKRDVEWSLEVRSAAEAIKNATGCPERVSETSVSRMLDKGDFFRKNRDKLPLTSQTLTEVNESCEAFSIRRIIWMANEFRKEGITPKHNQLLRRAGVRRLKDSLDIKRATAEVLESFAS
ncbi:MAG TPA: TnsD family Tn7-like transposition protein [Blastocatellia bacterium]|nr:TnsD family Tn7-like transposition protein [Blastocatellia bacterium]